MAKTDESLSFKIGDKIMGLGEIPELAGYTIVGGQIIGSKEESYMVKPEPGLCIDQYLLCEDSSVLIKKKLALTFNEGAWNRTMKHWHAFWQLGYSEEEEDQISEDVRRDMD